MALEGAYGHHPDVRPSFSLNLIVLRAVEHFPRDPPPRQMTHWCSVPDPEPWLCFAAFHLGFSVWEDSLRRT